MTPQRFVSFDRPGFAKIATSLRVDPPTDDWPAGGEANAAIP